MEYERIWIWIWIWGFAFEYHAFAITLHVALDHHWLGASVSRCGHEQNSQGCRSNIPPFGHSLNVTNANQHMISASDMVKLPKF